MDASPSLPQRPPQRLVVLACEVLKQEVGTFAKDHPHIIAVEVLEMNLHEAPLRLRDTLGKRSSKLKPGTGLTPLPWSTECAAKA